MTIFIFRHSSKHVIYSRPNASMVNRWNPGSAAMRDINYKSSYRIEMHEYYLNLYRFYFLFTYNNIYIYYITLHYVRYIQLYIITIP